MAVLYVTEFSNFNVYSNPYQLGIQPPVAEQAIATSGTSAQSAAFKSNTNIVKLQNDSSSAINFAFGANPTAVASTSARLPANGSDYFVVPQGQSFKVAAITVAL